MAIENEDFDSAKILKHEIDRLRHIAMQLDTDRLILTPIRQQRPPLRDMNKGSNQENYEDLRVPSQRGSNMGNHY